MPEEEIDNNNNSIVIVDRKMKVEITKIVVLWISALIIMSFHGNFFSDQSARNIGFSLIGLAFIICPNAWTAYSNYFKPKYLFFIQYGPNFFRFLGATFIIRVIW